MEPLPIWIRRYLVVTDLYKRSEESLFDLLHKFGRITIYAKNRHFVKLFAYPVPLPILGVRLGYEIGEQTVKKRDEGERMRYEIQMEEHPTGYMYACSKYGPGRKNFGKTVSDRRSPQYTFFKNDLYLGPQSISDVKRLLALGVEFRIPRRETKGDTRVTLVEESTECVDWEKVIEKISKHMPKSIEMGFSCSKSKKELYEVNGKRLYCVPISRLAKIQEEFPNDPTLKDLKDLWNRIPHGS